MFGINGLKIGWSDLKTGIIFFLLLTLCATIAFSCLSCKSFDPIWIEELPAECNMSLNAYKLYYQAKDKSATVPPSEACYKKLHRIYCQGEAFGISEDGKANPVDYQDAVKYRNYEQCRSELK
ncbi:MAG: hypothetical protein CVV44_03890 [Spirochaetae bacterium HGW-Spirochaetae-1]|jgi:hypothetical protein|nr:MAG: hypothetical protein CVV44_03890 [Spirochaetae bacterium HGW-Spirochaetae-1]